MKVLIADAHESFRGNLSHRLQRFAKLTELQEVTGFSSLTALADRKKSFDVIFIDKDVLGMNWKEKFSSLSVMFPEARLVMMSESEDQEDILDTLGFDVAGYITKLSPVALIADAVRLIMDGRMYLPPAALKGLSRSRTEEGDHTAPLVANVGNMMKNVVTV